MTSLTRNLTVLFVFTSMFYSQAQAEDQVLGKWLYTAIKANVDYSTNWHSLPNAPQKTSKIRVFTENSPYCQLT